MTREDIYCNAQMTSELVSFQVENYYKPKDMKSFKMSFSNIETIIIDYKNI